MKLLSLSKLANYVKYTNGCLKVSDLFTSSIKEYRVRKSSKHNWVRVRGTVDSTNYKYAQGWSEDLNRWINAR